MPRTTSNLFIIIFFFNLKPSSITIHNMMILKVRKYIRIVTKYFYYYTYWAVGQIKINTTEWRNQNKMSIQLVTYIPNKNDRRNIG